MDDLSRCAIHTITNKPWTLARCCEAYAGAGVGGVSIWRDRVTPQNGGVGLDEAVKIVRGSGLAVPSYVRGGAFCSCDDAARREAIDLNKRIIDEAAALGAEQVVMVVGTSGEQTLEASRTQAVAGLTACLDHAEAAGVKLSIEALHPMYAADRSCINRLADARAVCEMIAHPMLGLVVDVYHTWWDPEMSWEVEVAGEQGTLFGLHVSDWRVETRDMQADRGLMGDGCADPAAVRRLMERSGFDGMVEVEVFSDAYWAMDQDEYLKLIVERLLDCV